MTETKKWVAWIDHGKVRYAEIIVKETAAQYRVDRSQFSETLPWECINYGSVVRKDSNVLFDTAVDALEALLKQWRERETQLEQSLEKAKSIRRTIYRLQEKLLDEPT